MESIYIILFLINWFQPRHFIQSKPNLYIWSNNQFLKIFETVHASIRWKNLSALNEVYSVFHYVYN